MKIQRWVLAVLVCGAFGVGCKGNGNGDDMSIATGGTGGASGAGGMTAGGVSGFGAGAGGGTLIDTGGLFGLPGMGPGMGMPGAGGMVATGSGGMVATGSGGMVATGSGGMVATGTGGTEGGTGGAVAMGGMCPSATFADFGITLDGCCTPDGQCGIDGTAVMMPGCTDLATAGMMAEAMGAPPGVIPPPQPCP